MATKVISNPSILEEKSTKQVMLELTIALLILFVYSTVNMFNLDSELGIRNIILMTSSVAAAWLVEIVWFFFADRKNIMKQNKALSPEEQINPLVSAAKKTMSSFPYVTAIILTLSITVQTTVYALVIGTIVAILVGKLLYGGFGHNIFNPAGVGRAIIVLGIAVTTSEAVNEVIMGLWPNGAGVDMGVGKDVVAGATLTPIFTQADWATLNIGSSTMWTWDLVSSLWLGFKSNIPFFKMGAMGETQSILLIGLGIVLAFRKILDWRILVSYLGSFAIFVWVAALGLDGATAEQALIFTLAQMAIGGLLFGAVFMATDPVTMPMHPAGRVIYGIGLAFFTVLIRFAPGYPEGVLFAILIMNMLSPSIEKMFKGKLQSRKDLQIIAVSSSFLLMGGIALLALRAYFGI